MFCPTCLTEVGGECPRCGPSKAQLQAEIERLKDELTDARAAIRILKLGLAEREVERDKLLDEIAEWKSATMLETQAGDPADLTPANLEEHITELRGSEAKLREVVEAAEYGQEELWSIFARERMQAALDALQS